MLPMQYIINIIWIFIIAQIFTKSRNQQNRHVTHLWDKNLTAQQYVILRGRDGQVTKVPGQAAHITTEQYADRGNRTPRARVSLHIQKPKLHGKHKK